MSLDIIHSGKIHNIPSRHPIKIPRSATGNVSSVITNPATTVCKDHYLWTKQIYR